MHWLPLVAMVIASALPFPRCPVASIVAAVSEPGRSLDSHRENIDDSSATLPASRVPMDYNSHSNASQKDYDITVSGKAGHLVTTGVNKELRYRSKIKGRLQTLKWKQKQNSHQSKQTVPSKNMNSVGLNAGSNTEGDRLRGTNVSGRRYDSSQEDYLLNVYKSENSRAGGEISPHHSPETWTDKDDLRPAKQSENSLGLEAGQGQEGLHEEELLFLDAHPRVLFSSSRSPPKRPPVLLMLETGTLPEEGDEEDELADADGHTEGHGDREMDRSAQPGPVDTFRGTSGPAPRLKRSHLSYTEKSVCDMRSDWVDKKTAIDSRGHTVSIVSTIKTATGNLKQYFYETTCRRPEQQTAARATASAVEAGEVGVLAKNGGSCLGVDKRQWVSECKDRHTYVRALTIDDKGLHGWRWIRINTSCVCVLLSRVNRHHRGA
ncbi:hypothetical protein DPEC_G00305000 [Dallia pectoralis]|uniref:Uncharacterized protein n=1 Tax=Dallia pectoralis TaxID=75939 RepID=A0ACC2FDS5_DALPE|nr:hypothetical protein DPEC_G00305000 [Dallia pectoralis]